MWDGYLLRICLCQSPVYNELIYRLYLAERKKKTARVKEPNWGGGGHQLTLDAPVRWYYILMLAQIVGQ
jgi:hypothetical protein